MKEYTGWMLEGLERIEPKQLLILCQDEENKKTRLTFHRRHRKLQSEPQSPLVA